ncbi:GNAT family N-acetyltransferase [Xanthomonas sp. SHU 166]|uniref:GNAT family N-acetyltransferase n=1 Tax=Xanthomonas sp. SHU 166 TaxID=1591170 RepID=UPI0012FF166D|nr:GNAT family N-acetyltransferase [Xanthomonas sp. SHU 166]
MEITETPTPEQIQVLQGRLSRDRGAPIADVYDDLVEVQLMAVEAGVPVGIASIRQYGTEAELYKLYVVPEYRRRRVGEALFQGTLHWMQQHGLLVLNIEMIGESYRFWKTVTQGLQVTPLGQEKFFITL